jgi:hypothetical protein
LSAGAGFVDGIIAASFAIRQSKNSAVTSHRVAAFCFPLNSPLFEIARVLVRFDHVASRIVNANHSIM